MDAKKIDSINALLLGTNGTGKSTTLRRILEDAATSRRVLVVPSNPAEKSFKDIRPIELDDVKSFKGVKKVMCYEEEEFVHVAKHARNCVLISDDFRNYLPRNTLNKHVRRMFINRRHLRLDIYMAAHGFTQVPPEFFNWLNLIFLYRTVDNPKRHREKFGNMEAFLEVVGDVNRKAKQDAYHYQIVEYGGV